MKKLFKSYLFNISLIVGLTVFVLWWTLKDNYEEIFEIMSHANVAWIVAIIVICLGYHAIIGWILEQLTRLSNPHYKLSHGIVNAFVAAFFHGITPSASGGQFAQVYVFKKQGVQISDSASVLWMDFILYQSTMVLSVLILILLRFRYFYEHSSFFALVLVGFTVNGMVIVGLWALARFPSVYTWISTKGIELGAKFKLIKNKEKTLSMLKLQLDRFNSETIKLKSNKIVLLKVIIANLVRLGLYYTLPFFCAKALSLDVSLSLLLNVMALSSFVAMINAFIPIPGASGGTEATYVLMFSTIFGGTIKAASTMILWRFATYYLIMLVGAITFIWVKSRPGIEGVKYTDFKKEDYL